MENENPVLDFIRKNIPLKRVVEVEKCIPSLEEYVKELTETVYRSYRGSCKVDSSKARGIDFLYSILYLLTGEPIKSEDWAYSFEEEIPYEIEKVFQNYFVRNSYFRNYAVQYFKAKVGRKIDGRVVVDPYAFKLIGGESFFYLTLNALLNVIRRAHEDPAYSYRIMTWEEAITDYLISGLKTRASAIMRKQS